MKQLKIIFIGDFDPYLRFAIIDIIESFKKTKCLTFTLSQRSSRYHIADADYIFFDNDFGKGRLCHPYLMTRKNDSILFSLSKHDVILTHCFKGAIQISYDSGIINLKRKICTTPNTKLNSDIFSNCRSCNCCRLSAKQELFLRYYFDEKSLEFISEMLKINIKGIYNIKVSIKNALYFSTLQELHRFAKFYFEQYEY